MKHAGYSLIEVLVAAVVVAAGLTAATLLVGSIMSQQELNTVSLRAANLQEQAVTLYRLGVAPGGIRAILPEDCTDSATPGPGTFSLTFATETGTQSELVIAGATNTYLSNSCTVVFPNPPGALGIATYSTNTVTVLTPEQP